MNWLEEISIKRRAQQTSIFIIETFDLKRIRQFQEACRTTFDDHSLYHFDVQTMKIKEATANGSLQFKEVPIDGSPMDFLDAKLTTGKAVVSTAYVLTDEQAKFFANQMLAWHLDNRLYNMRFNTVVFFAASAEYFPQALRRFVHTINIPAAAVGERKDILEKVRQGILEVGKAQAKKPPEMKVTDTIIEACSGLTLSDIEAASMESFLKHKEFKVEEFTRRKVDILGQFGIEYVDPTRGFDSVAGYTSLKEYIHWRIIRPLKEPAVAAKYGLTIPKGALLLGLPGCGKTWFAKALAKEVGLAMLKFSPTDFLRSLVGESEARLKQLTTLIESMSPCIVFIDEFDQLAMPRDSVMSTDSGVSRRSQNQILEWMGDENRHAFIIGATNFAKLDKAFVRPGRIDEVLVVLPPNEDARKEILVAHTNFIRKVPVLGALDYRQLAKETKWWSGAELEKLVLDAAAIGFKDSTESVTIDHFRAAMKGFEVNLEEREKALMNLIKDVKQLEQYNKVFLESQLAEFASTDVDDKAKFTALYQK